MCRWKQALILLLLLTVYTLAEAALVRATSDELEQDVYRLVNEHRASRGLKPLTFNPEIAAIARRRSQDMATGQVGVGHAGAQGRQHAITRIMTMRGVAENVAANSAGSPHVADMAIADWLTSPGHRRSTKGAYDLTGIGVAQGPTGAYFFTQLFVRAPSFHLGTAGSDTTDKSSAPEPRAARIEQHVVENRPSLTYKRPYGKPRYEKDPHRGGCKSWIELTLGKITRSLTPVEELSC